MPTFNFFLILFSFFGEACFSLPGVGWETLVQNSPWELQFWCPLFCNIVCPTWSVWPRVLLYQLFWVYINYFFLSWIESKAFQKLSLKGTVDLYKIFEAKMVMWLNSVDLLQEQGTERTLCLWKSSSSEFSISFFFFFIA